MIAELANGALVCGRCERAIRAGEPVYRVTSRRLVRCEDCARVGLIGPLPCPLRTPKFSIVPKMPDDARFDAQSMRRDLWKRVQGHDPKARQVGSE